MEEQDEKRLEPSPKAHLISLMQAGHPWQKASAMAGLHISQSTAYRLFQAIQTQGDAAILDGRHEPSSQTTRRRAPMADCDLPRKSTNAEP